MYKIAVLSDIHGNILALEKVAEDLKRRGVEGAVNLGDHASGPLWPKETIQYLMQQDWIHILGNHDRNLIEQPPDDHGLSDRYAYQALDPAELDWLRGLPSTLQLENGIFLFHATPSSDTTYLLETVQNDRARLATQEEISARLGKVEARLCLCGHTHIPRVIEMAGKNLIVNPGSVGLPAYEDDKPHYHVMETGSPHARYAIIEQRNGKWGVELIALEYDHLKAAQQARKNERADWEIALRSGFMS